MSLRDQDRAQWQGPLIIAAKGLLTGAASLRLFGRFQIDAALKSLHVQTPTGRDPDPQPLVVHYDLLAAQAPSLGGLVARAVAHGQLHGLERGLAILDDLPPDRIACDQPYWAARAEVLRQSGDTSEHATREQAIDLTDDPAVKAFLRPPVH